MEENWKLERIVFGIRHKRTFQVTDKFGEFVDKIVPLQGHNPFPNKCFTKVGRPDRLSIEVRDAERTLSVIYNADGIVLDCDMLAEPPLTIDTVLNMFKEVSELAIPLTEGKNKIDRLGILFNYSVSSFENSAKEIFSKVLNINTKGTPDEISMRFALKLPVSDVIYQPDKKTDYKNVFIGIATERTSTEDDDDENVLRFPTLIRVSIDYQRYYEPPRTFKDINMSEHLSGAQEYISESVRKSNLNFQPLQYVKNG